MLSKVHGICWKYCGVELQQYCTLTTFILLLVQRSQSLFLFAEQNNYVNAAWEARRPTWSKYTEGRAGEVGSAGQHTKYATEESNCVIITRNCDKSHELYRNLSLLMSVTKIWYTHINMVLMYCTNCTIVLVEICTKWPYACGLWQWLVVWRSVFCSRQHVHRTSDH